MSFLRFALSLVLVVAYLAPGASQSLAQPAAPATLAAPGAMLIVENTGQWPEAARFQVWNSPLGAGTIWLTEDGIWLVVAGGRWQVAGSKLQVAGSEGLADPLADLPPATFHALRLTFPGSNPDVRIEPFDPLTTTVSYFIGNDPTQWRADVPVWGGVRYVNLYSGVDLVIGGAGDAWQLEAEPCTAVVDVRMHVDGAGVLALDGLTMQLEIATGSLSVALPSAAFPYQVSGISHKDDPFVQTVDPNARRSQPASPTDDPGDLLYGTFLGGSSSDEIYAIAADMVGNAYVAGNTLSSDFPTTPGAFQPSLSSNWDATLAKVDSTGGDLVYATFLGGSGGDWGYAIAVDTGGSAYVTGRTSSDDFATTSGAFSTGYNGGADAYVVKLSPAGSNLVYATFLGGSDEDEGRAIAVDETGAAYLAGSTVSGDFPTTPGVYSPSHNGNLDAFAIKLNPVGSNLVYATYVGSPEWDEGRAIAVDSAGSAFVAGWTRSDDFPTTPDAFDTTFNGWVDAYVAKLNSVGNQLVYATFLGGDWDDHAWDIAVDQLGNALVTGETRSSNFPSTPGSFDPSFNGGYVPRYNDSFVVKLNPTGSELVYATFLGSSRGDYGRAIDVDCTGSAVVAGSAGSNDFPTTANAYDTTFNGGDAFVAKFNLTGSELTYASFLGGTASEWATAVAIDGAGNALVAGWTWSVDFPTTPNAFDSSFNGGAVDAFVAKLDVFEPPSAVALVALQAGEGSNGRFARLVAAALGLMVMVSLRRFRQQKPSNR